MVPDVSYRKARTLRRGQQLIELTYAPESVRGIMLLYISIYLRRFLLPVAAMAALLMAATLGADYLWELF